MRVVASLKICILMCYFCRKYNMFDPKMYREIMCHNTEEWCKIWGGTDLCFKKWHEELRKFWPTLEGIKICPSMGSFLPKYIVLVLKMYRGVMHHYTEDRSKRWRKNNLCFHKWHEEFQNLHFERRFCPRYIMFELKKYRGVMCYDTEGWCNI